ncbi:hypothetical protein ACR9HU_23250 (plasmid) [Enterobacter ludwigii]|jgi:hypothetical protein
MDEKLKHADLSSLPEPVREAARELVDLKFRIDMAARGGTSGIPLDLHGTMTGGEWGPHFGQEFFCSIIPFFPRDFETCSATEMLVPTLHTFGCSWRWWPDRYCSDKDEHDIRRHIFSDYGLKSTSYTFIPQLGLFCPGEGKNRVNFCRHHGIEYIPARVYPHDYPEANRISVYVQDTAGGLDVWAVLDNRYVQKVTHYAFALPLFRAYGVAFPGKWPAGWPSISDLLANQLCCTDDTTFHKPVIDMHAVRDVLNRDKTSRENGEMYVKTNLVGLPAAGMLRFVCVSLVLCVAALLVSCFFTGWELGNIALALATFMAGGIAAVLLPVFRIKRKFLKRQHHSAIKCNEDAQNF